MNPLKAMKTDAINYLVIGAGVTGWSALNFLQAQQARVRIMDSRAKPPYAQQLNEKLSREEICLGAFDEQWILESDVVVLSPGVSLQLPIIQEAIAAGVEVLGDIELFAKYAEKPYIAITGSNGKSTVTTLVTEILNSQGISAKAGGNIGTPALDLLDDGDVDIYVLELSSFQLEVCHSLQPAAAVVLNISDDHMDRHNTLEEYTRIKRSIYQQAANKVYCRSQNELRDLNDKKGKSFGLDAPEGNNFGVIKTESGRWLVQADNKIMSTAELSLLGATGELNALAALSLTSPYIKDMSRAVEVLKQFSGLPYRCQLVSAQNDVCWINDSKGTNVGATVAAIESVNRSLVLMLGGIHKGGSVKALVEVVRDRVKQVIVFGRDQEVFKQALTNVVPVDSVDSLEGAVQIALAHVKKGDAVLFSPACTSFDMFEDYQERGEAFNHAVKKLVVGDQCEN